MFVGGGGGVGCNMLTLYGRGMTLSKGERGGNYGLWLCKGIKP